MTKEETIICSACSAENMVKPERTFLGFRTFECGACGGPNRLPLSTNYRNVYWVIMIIVAFSLVEGGFGLLPGVALAGASIALLRDHKLRGARRHLTPAVPQQIPAPSSASSISQAALSQRECPWCAETILSKARVCKHCGRDVEPVSS